MSETNEKLLVALRKIMKPVIRLMIRNNVTLQIFVDILKELYVKTAEESLQQDIEKATDSHISLITGLHRKDVKEYRQHTSSHDTAPLKLTTGAELLATWMGDPRYIDAEGQPLPLPYAHADGDMPSFSRLAEEISSDIRPRAQLDELARLGFVDISPITDTVTLKTDSFIPKDDWKEKIHFLGQNNGDHLSATVSNIMSSPSPFLDRCVYHDRLSEESIKELKKFSTDASMKALRAVNRKAFELSEKDARSSGQTYRMNLGVYFYAEPDNNDNNNEDSAS